MPPDDLARKTLPWLVFLTIGSVVGVWLGYIIVSDFRPLVSARTAPYAELSGNPDALSIDSHPVAPCENCADSYGSARYATEQHAPSDDNVYRDLGRVVIDYSQSEAPADDYRYGGRFPDRSSPQSADPADYSMVPDATVRKRGGSKRVILPPVEAQPDVVPLDRNVTPLIY